MHCGNSKKLLNSLLPTLESTLSSIIDTSMEQKINYIQERNMETRVALEQCEIELKKNFPNHCTELLKKINFEELLPYEIITISSALKKLRPLIPIEKFLEMDRVMFRDLLVNYDRVIMLSEAISSNLFAHLLVADQVKSRLVVRNIPAFLFLLRHDIDFSELMNLDRDTLKAVLHHSQEFVNLIKNGIDFNLITKLESDLLTETLENDNLPIDSRLIGILGRFPTKIRTLLASEVKFSTFLTAWKCLLDHGFPFMLVDLFQTHIMKDLINHYDKIDLKLVLRFLKKYDSIPVIEGLFQEGFKFSYFSQQLMKK